MTPHTLLEPLLLVVTASREARLAAAVDEIDALLGKGWHFTDPL